MAKRKIIGDNCYGMFNGIMQKIPVGTIIEASETAFGKKAVTVDGDEQKTMEVATPDDQSVEDDDDDRQTYIELYEEKFGKKPHGRMSTENIKVAVESED